MLQNNNLGNALKNNTVTQAQLEEAAMKKNYFHPFFAIVSGLAILGATLAGHVVMSGVYWKNKELHDTKYKEVKEVRLAEVENEVKRIVRYISSSSNLVYTMSLFHTSPREILEEVEKAIYIWPNKVYTNENVTFKNYNNISVGLITQDLENFATLIKKLKKLYSDTFDIKGFTDFTINYELDDKGIQTGKVFFSTDVNLTYKKDPGSNLAKTWILQLENNEGLTQDTTQYQNNVQAFEIFKRLIDELKEKKSGEGKGPLYVTATTDNDSMYFGTDIEYLGRNVYYITNEYALTDLFQLNGVGDKADYEFLKSNIFKILLVTDKNGTQYGMCTKVLKDESELSELEREDKTRVYTKTLTEGGLGNSVATLCELL